MSLDNIRISTSDISKTVTPLLDKGVTKVSIGDPLALLSNHEKYYKEIASFFTQNRVYPNVTSFLPVDIEYITDVIVTFPNLDTLELVSLPGEEIPWNYLFPFRKVIIYSQEARDDIPFILQEKVEVITP